jgi:hypothetical protein
MSALRAGPRARPPLHCAAKAEEEAAAPGRERDAAAGRAREALALAAKERKEAPPTFDKDPEDSALSVLSEPAEYVNASLLLHDAAAILNLHA